MILDIPVTVLILALSSLLVGLGYYDLCKNESGD